MKRVLSLVLALVLVLGMIPTFAADATGAQHLYDHGFITGKDGATVDAKLDVNAKLTRAELAALIAELNGAKEEAAAFAQPADFTDAAMFQDWAKPYIAYAQENGWMTGYPDGSFGANKEVPANQLAAVLLNALGYTFEYSKVLTTAAELGIVVEGTALTRGEAFEAMWTAVSAVNINGEEMTLGVKLGKLDPPAPVVTDVKIDSVTATNLKEIVVKFNQAVDKATVLAANFSLSPAAGTLTPVLGADGMTVTITTSVKMDNQGAYKLTAEKVANADAAKLAKVVTPFTAFDATLPTANEIVVTGPKTFDIYFSEPIDSAVAGSITVKSANTTLAVKTKAADDSNVVSVELYTELTDATAYDVTVKDYADFAGYKNVIKTFAMTYAKDNTAPTVSLVSANQQYVVVEFNKPVTGIDKTYFYHTFSAWTPMNIYKTKADMLAGTNAITTATTNVSTVYVQFATTGVAGQFPLQAGTVNVNVLGTVGSASVKDNWGNKLATTVLAANVVADLTAPMVTKVEATSNTTVAITFDKAVNPGTTANYEVLKSDGTAISGLTFTVAASSTTKVVLTLSKSLLGETVIVNVKNIEDTTLNKNKLASTSTTTITFADAQFDGISRVEYDATAKVIYVVYAEAMGNSAVDAANYKLDDAGTIRALAGPVSFFSGNTVVKIELSATEAAYVTAGTDNLLIANAVKDIAGNGSAAFQTSKPIVAIGAAAPALKVVSAVPQIKAIDKNTVTVQFDQELVAVDPTDFVLSLDNGGTWNAPTAQALSLNSTGTLVTLTFAQTIPAEVPATVKVKGTFVGTETVNVFSIKPVDFAATAVVDKIVPTLVTKELTAVNTITLTYSENIDPASVSIFTYTVAGNTVSAFNVTGAKTVVLTLGTAVTANATPSVTQALDILDVVGNKLVASAAVTAADKVAPSVVSSALAADDKTFTITFSEDIANNTADTTALKAAITTATDAATWVALNAADTVTITGNTLVIVFNTALVADTQDIQIAASTLKDLATTANVLAGATTIANIVATTN